ncbi:Fur family transcriptional regulator [Propioniciclava soli]|uniref:Fur family transcriptional regulator n=1 Tax=Propioniciclava soli TaxID=2775081 RepID=UPI001E55D0A9
MDVDTVLDRTATLLRARGDRMTTPRRAVLTALASHPGHWSAEEIAAFVADPGEDGGTSREAGVHRSSVYRTLETLSELGVVQHVHLGHGTTVYHLVESAHLHAQCRSCGRLVDVPAAVLDAAAAALASEHGFRLDPTHVALSGTCAACQQGESASG